MTVFKSAFRKGAGALSGAGAQITRSQQMQPTPPGPAPWDSQYQTTVSALQKTRDTGLAGVAADRATLQSNYGYNLDGTENTSDPYSKLAQLRGDYEKIKRGSSTGYAARGQLYAGSFQNQVNSDAEAQNRSLDALKKDFNSQASGLAQQENAINADYSGGIINAGNTRIDQAASNVADGSSPVASASPRQSAVLSALSTPNKWTPKHLAALKAEAKKNGWIS